MKKDQLLTVKYCALQGTYWMLAAVGLAFVTPLLETKGFQGTEIGWLNAVKYISVIVFQILIADFSDKHAKTVPLKWIMQILGVIGIVDAIIFWFAGKNFILMVFVFILFGLSVNCLSPIIDALSIQYMNHGRNFNYSISRATGSGCWAISCVIIGMFSDAFGVNNIMLLQIGATIFFLLVTVIMDPVDLSKGEVKKEEQPSQKEVVHSSWYLVRRYPKYTCFLIACMIIFMGYNLNTLFLVDRFEALGGSHSNYGVAEFVLALSEIPFAVFFLRIRKYIPVDKMMFICALFCTVRAAATAFSPSVLLLTASQSLEILGLAIFYPGCAYFVMENLPEADVVKGVSFINVASVGIGETIASLACGVLKDRIGLQGLMNTSVVVSVLAVIVMFIMLFLPKEKALGHD